MSIRIDYVRDDVTIIDAYDDVETAIAEFARFGFEDEPAELLRGFYAVVNSDNDRLVAVIRYRQVIGREWPDMVVNRLDQNPPDPARVYRRIDNGPDDVYGCDRLSG